MQLDESHMAKVYADAQKASGIKVGDWVRLKKSTASFMAGKIYSVCFIDDGIILGDGRVSVRVPYFHLEKVDYATAQAESGLKVGDKVRVIRKANNFEKEWGDAWSPAMDSWVGKEATIVSITAGNRGIRLNCAAEVFPFFVLEKVEAKEEPAPEESECPFKRGDEVLVRDSPNGDWVRVVFFEFIPTDESPYHAGRCGEYSWKYCIPYAGNEAIWCTNNSPDDAEKAQKADTAALDCPFKAGDLVLVRDNHVKAWIADRFEAFDPSNEDEEFYVTSFSLWSQCIPFEGNQHLIGTADSPSEKQEAPQPAEDALVDDEIVEVASRSYNLKTGDLVLGRDEIVDWTPDIFLKEKGDGRFICLNCSWTEVVPYAGNEHLLK